MSKRLILILTLVFVLGISYGAYAEVQNVKVSGDLAITGVARNSLTLKDNESVTDYDETITAILSQVRLRVDADLTDNVSTTVRLINERAWGDEADAALNYSSANRTSRSNNTDISLDLAYVTLKEFLYSPLTLTVGRQELRYGNALIIGDPDSNNYSDGHLTTARYLPNSLDDLSLRKAFDAIKATLDYDPLVIDLVYAKIDENAVQAYDDVDLVGVNAAYQVNKDLSTEAYFWQRNRDVGMAGITGGVFLPSKAEKLRTVGAKGLYTGIDNLILSLESAFQFGNNVTILYTNQASTPANRKVTAYAIQAGGMYTMPDVRYTPSLLVAYTYLSGAKYLSTSDNYTGWDPMFEDQATGTIYNKLAAQSNSQSINIDASIKPMDDLTATLKYMHVRLLNPYTGTPTGIILTGLTGDPTYTMKADKKHFGDEVDLVLTYDYTEDVQFGLNTGVFIPGSAFDSANDKTATQVIGSMKVTF